MHHRDWPPACVTGLVILGATGLCSCAVGPDFHAPAAPATEQYVAGAPITTVAAADPGAAAQTLVADQEIPAQWWGLFHSAPLDALVRTALQDSPTIVAAAAALRSAQEGYVAQRGAHQPVQGRAMKQTPPLRGNILVGDQALGLPAGARLSHGGHRGAGHVLIGAGRCRRMEVRAHCAAAQTRCSHRHNHKARHACGRPVAMLH